MLNQKHKGIIFVAIGAVCFSAKAVFIKLCYKNYDVDDITLLALRFGLALPFFIGVAFYRYRKGNFKEIEKTDWLRIAIVSMLGYYIASWLDFKGLQYISASLERIILFVYPTLVVIFSRIIFKKKITNTGLWALGICYLGLVFIAFDPHIFDAKDFKFGALCILISAITYALYLVFGSELINKYGSINFNAISLVFASAFVLTHFKLSSSVNLFQLPAGIYAYGLALAIISTVIPTFLVMEGIKLLGANLGSIVGSIGPASTIVMGYFFLGEVLSIQELFGSVLVLAGVLLISVKK